jgi:hypothetical protein
MNTRILALWILIALLAASSEVVAQGKEETQRRQACPHR